MLVYVMDPSNTEVPKVLCLLLQVEAALRTALTLLAYEDVLNGAELYSFLALVAFYSGFFGICSKVREESAYISPHEFCFLWGVWVLWDNVSVVGGTKG
jgi:hypothetical protein